ncbi:nucleic acid-binding protein [Halobellus rubicundus]|uniref:Nucleic acid-binding protein n=1 Tax=Halobellus rubicundus TaxID=2996466 RepID=A0ABD5MFD3_9EURY
MTLAAVSDAGPLIHLAEIDSLALLSAFETLLIPETVYDEIERGGLPDGISDLSYDLVDAEWSSVESDELDPGERAAIAVAGDREIVLLTDDLAARDSASADGIDVHGSIGVVALGYSRGLLDRDDAASRMRALQREASLFVSEAVVERGIRMLDGHRNEHDP